VQPHVVAGGVHPVDLVGPDEKDAAAGLDDDAVGRLSGFGLQILHHRQQPLAEIAGTLPFQALARALQRAQEPRPVERLQQVVERMDLEGAQRVLVVGGREDDHRQALRRERADDAEAVHDRNLHVEEDQLGLEPLDG
jgi:hypothetical protein